MESSAAPNAPVAVPSPAAETDEGTRYIVLRLSDEDFDGNRAWVEHDETVAAGKDEAIRAVAGREGGKFKAVPVRNWAGGLEMEPETITRMVAKPLEL